MERFTISLDDRLAEQFDAWMASRSYANRSEAVRDLLRAELGKSQLESPAGKHFLASLSYVFTHHQRDLADSLLEGSGMSARMSPGDMLKMLQEGFS